MRDRLIELSRAAHGEWLKKEYDHETKQTVAEYVADHLLANGVIVQAHGYWKIKGVLIRATGAKNYTCSVCGKENFHTPFCSECGAKMDAEREGKR